MPLLPSEYTRNDLRQIIRGESATAARRSEDGHDGAAQQHQDNADEARQMISARH
ncbi:hypothetical protein ACTMTF_48560 [Nonomuraea sp. ZG12]|uniref:hypothetical protein n=1 Tax=Nonomuraea sp. ZG12 TaxID=3452207 RepID=UPI003F88FB5A